jgi:fucose 4-O-acetylase-like acetyltransferase
MTTQRRTCAAVAGGAGRDATIDVYKGGLTLLMIAAHVVQLCRSSGGAAEALSLAANLTCFPAYLFCFGFACHRAYLAPDRAGRTRPLAATILKILAAYYASAIAATLFLSRAPLPAAISGLLLFERIPAYSEFLLAFAATLLVARIARAPLLRIASSPNATALALALLLLTTFLPYSLVQRPQLGILVGSDSVSLFPVLQYFGFFLLGVHVSIHPDAATRASVAAAAAALAAWSVQFLAGGAPPERFPPSATWILLSFAAVVVGLAASGRIGASALLRAKLAAIGENVLFYLLLSNLILFAVVGSYPDVRLSLPEALVAFAALMGVLGYFASLVHPPRAAPA